MGGGASQSAPDDHFAAGPDCRVLLSGSGRVGGAGGCPTIGAGIVSPAGVQIANAVSAPDDHFAAGPHCRVTVSGSGRVGRAGGRPTIGVGIVSAAGVQTAEAVNPPQTIISLPVQTAVCTIRGVGRVGGAGGRPTIRARDCICRRCSRSGQPPLNPPQTIISLPVQTAV